MPSATARLKKISGTTTSRPATPMTSSRLLARALPKSSDAPSVNSASGVATELRLRSGVSMRVGMGMRKYQSKNPASVPKMSGLSNTPFTMRQGELFSPPKIISAMVESTLNTGTTTATRSTAMEVSPSGYIIMTSGMPKMA